MTHDYVHCLNFKEDCPKKCFRAQLMRDLMKRPHYEQIATSWATLKGTEECPMKGKTNEIQNK